MKAHLSGCLDQAAIAVIGFWDPVTSDHRDLFALLAADARSRGLASLVIAIDPHPAAYRPGEPAYPVHTDLCARIPTVLGTGVDAVLALRFTGRDVYAGVREVLGAVAPVTRVAELWLGAEQRLGRGERGDAAAVNKEATAHRIAVRRLSPHESSSYDVRTMLRAGRVAEVGRVVGRPPVRSRPLVGDLRFGWLPGPYVAVPLDQPDGCASGASLAVELEPRERGAQRLVWPDRSIPYLAFVSGPSETAVT